ncbi:hypothetical protein CB0940_00854 [Cercospora beticola]|uniref:Uncharacterized protein n=2 Tax=Cercospora beticola TaxID=122368 RepID=A0A2G5ICA1_CERBT|nr:hypothetical protein CB0940_00854 [Cercospora beticola]PIB02342.1 hypothetical protein CB0940_00854 [Cercospora beticola]
MCSPTMPRNKDRFYLALYTRAASTKPVMPGKEDKYHWAFLIGPKHENKSSQGTKCHAKDVVIIDETKDKYTIRTEYHFEERKVWLTAVDMIVVRLLLGKVLDKERLMDVLRGTRVKKHSDAGGWNSVSWTKDVLDRLTREDGILGASVIEWETVRHSALWYIEEKTAQHRFDGKAIGTFDKTKVPTWDLVNDIELEP